MASSRIAIDVYTGAFIGDTHFLNFFLLSCSSTDATATIGLTAVMGTMLVSLFNAISIFGSIALLMLRDLSAVQNISLLSSLDSMPSVFPHLTLLAIS